MSGQKKKMMELISDYNKVAGYKATYESSSHKAWAPLDWLLLHRPLGDWTSYAENRPLFSGNLETIDQCLCLGMCGLPVCQGGSQHTQKASPTLQGEAKSFPKSNKSKKR